MEREREGEPARAGGCGCARGREGGRRVPAEACSAGGREGSAGDTTGWNVARGGLRMAWGAPTGVDSVPRVWRFLFLQLGRPVPGSLFWITYVSGPDVRAQLLFREPAP